MKKSHSYKEALKKQTLVIIIALLIIYGLLWHFIPINTPYKFIIFSAIVLIVGGSTFWYVRQAGYKVFCDGCKKDIFPYIELGKNLSTEIDYCPICGHKNKI